VSSTVRACVRPLDEVTGWGRGVGFLLGIRTPVERQNALPSAVADASQRYVSLSVCLANDMSSPEYDFIGQHGALGYPVEPCFLIPVWWTFVVGPLESRSN